MRQCTDTQGGHNSTLKTNRNQQIPMEKEKKLSFVAQLVKFSTRECAKWKLVGTIERIHIQAEQRYPKSSEEKFIPVWDELHGLEIQIPGVNDHMLVQE